MELIAAIVFITGLVFGSFISLVSYRLPLGEDMLIKPSRCPKCEAKLGFFDLFPVLSWLTSLGRCRHCGVRVSVRYPLTELATGGVFLLIYSYHGLTPAAFMLAAMAVSLLVMIVVDIEHYIIPDSVHVLLVPLGIAYHYAMLTDPAQVFGGLALGAGIGLSLHYGYRHLRKKEGLGFGDVKFFAVAGLWLGFKPIVPFLFYSGLLGVATGLLWRMMRRGEIFPFGPALAVALFTCVAFPEIPNLFWSMGNILK